MRQKLQERFTVSKEDIKKLPLKESEQIIEKDGTSYKCRGAYELPVWRLGEKNLNERIYPKQLGEKLVQESPITLGLANHPKEEADVLNTFAVEKNPHIKEDGIFYVDAYFVGDNGQLANEILEAGGQIGLSSSAYGDVDDNGNVMIEDFSIERFADWVDEPSYQVYASRDTTIINQSEKQEVSHESLDKETKEEEKLFEKDVTNNNIVNNNSDDYKKEKSMSTNSEKKKMSIEEKNLKLGVKHLFEEAEALENLREKRLKYQEILDYCEDVDFAEDYIKTANDNIKEIDEKLYELADKGKEVDSLKENTEKEKTELQSSLEEKEDKIKTLEEKYDKAVELLDELKLREQKLNEMYKSVVAEKNGMVTATEYRELDKYCEKQETELEDLKKDFNKLKRQLEKTKKRNTQVEKTERPIRHKPVRKEKVEEEFENTVAEDTVAEDKEDYSKYENLPNFEDIREWYERKLTTEPRIKEIKDEILSKRTLFEAQRAYMRFKDLIESTPSPYKNSYYGSEITEEEEKKPKKSYNSLPLKDGWV